MPTRITIRLTDERRERLDELVATGVFTSRTAALTAALDALLADEEQRAIDCAIVEGYTRIPPTPEEEAYANASARASIREEPW